ncbi:Membrane-associated lipoprotein involved in thiamine biosynthesis [Congregibacter litoralis KT71]|uniref:FAD:protein FMN transferase n=2 Tax=Congregibacter TaxID=393661 RepID=A4A898_9GAMM|nr:Membrane-associated lipoprotein involved in thiamine biosynthesis [Congregibacter litoralis KT71]
MHPGFRFFAAAIATVATVATAFLLSACDSGPQRVVLNGATMGTTWSVIYASPEKAGATVSPVELRALIEGELEAINQALSTYIPDSEISRLNAAQGPASVTLSPRFARVLDAALSLSNVTEGAYDVTVGPLVELWGFGTRSREGTPPSDAEIDEAMARVGSRKLSWDAGRATLGRPAGMRIDLSSIAKGYAVDELSALLAEQGIANSLVEIGGELRASGVRPEGSLWRLAVESPDPSKARFIEAIAVSDAAVATSGDYRNYFEYEGRRYSHLVDPRTGYPVAHDLVSVTVVHKNCMIADALATALIVLGQEAALALAEREGIAAHFVSRGDDGLEVHYTPAFESYRQSSQADAAKM